MEDSLKVLVGCFVALPLWALLREMPTEGRTRIRLKHQTRNLNSRECAQTTNLNQRLYCLFACVYQQPLIMGFELFWCENGFRIWQF